MTASAGTESSLEAWERELDAMEAYLANHREAFMYRDTERPPAREPLAPADLGPLPEALRARAESLLRATRAFEGELVDARASVSSALRHATRGRRPRAAYYDAQV
jgi:hypothetical protein